MDLNIDTAASFATEANLLKALEKRGCAGAKYLVVRNREGRWTAVFPFALNEAFLQGNITFFARQGFMTLN